MPTTFYIFLVFMIPKKGREKKGPMLYTSEKVIIIFFLIIEKVIIIIIVFV